MEKHSPFYDFCIPYNSNRSLMVKIMDELYELGYRTVAVEQEFEFNAKNDAKKGRDIFPEPADLGYLSKFKDKLHIFNRLTIIYSDPGVSMAMNNSPNYKKYHLVAGLPKTSNALTHCCTSFNGDIICCNAEEGKLSLSRKTYQVAVKRRLCFEIKYVPIIKDSTQRRNLIKIAHNYHSKGKSKNIIFSSGARSVFELRSPYDIANLALLFGLSEEQGKNALGSTCYRLFVNAESRRIGKTIMFVKKLGPLVLSSSSDGDDDDNKEDKEGDDSEGEENSDSEAAEKMEVEDLEKQASSENDDDSTKEQPSKKIKTC